MKCNIQYKGRLYNEEDASKIVSYHYLVEENLLGSDSIVKKANRLEINNKVLDNSVISSAEDIYEEIFGWSDEPTSSVKIINELKRIVKKDSTLYKLLDSINKVNFNVVFDEEFPTELSGA